jgi:ketosteroid isomerase-like protein
MSPPRKPQDPLESLRDAFLRFDSAFSRGDAGEIASLFSEDARLMWPGTEDIVGRQAIESALLEFFQQFTAVASFQHERDTVELGEKRAFTFGRFAEDLRPNGGGAAFRVHGRLVELWSQQEGGEWNLKILLTSRYAENEPLS